MTEAIVLAGGLGTRLRTLVSDVPKPMAPILGVPFLKILLTFLSFNGFKKVVLSVGYMGKYIENHFGSRFNDLEIRYSYEDTPLGTGGAVRLAFEQCAADHVYVLNGDTFLDIDFSDLDQYWSRNKRPVIVVKELDDIGRYGAVNIKGGHVTGFTEKGGHGKGFINAGCYILPRNIMNNWPIGKPFSLETDFLLHSVFNTTYDVFVTPATFIDIGVPDDYKLAQTILKEWALKC